MFILGNDIDNCGCFEVIIKFPHFLGCEFYDAFFDSEDCVIFAEFDIFTKMIFCTSLSNNDCARFRDLSRIELDSQSLTVGISTQSGTTSG